MKKQVISEEIALNELESFAAKWIKKKESKEVLKESYPDILESIMTGNLVIDENKVPIYTLLHPILNSEGQVSVSNVNFKTRIKPTDQANIAKGLDLKTESFMFSLRCISHIIGQPIAMLDNFEKEDYTVIRELSAVFM